MWLGLKILSSSSSSGCQGKCPAVSAVTPVLSSDAGTVVSSAKFSVAVVEINHTAGLFFNIQNFLLFPPQSEKWNQEEQL